MWLYKGQGNKRATEPGREPTSVQPDLVLTEIGPCESPARRHSRLALAEGPSSAHFDMHAWPQSSPAAGPPSLASSVSPASSRSYSGRVAARGGRAAEMDLLAFLRRLVLASFATSAAARSEAAFSAACCASRAFFFSFANRSTFTGGAA
eukprot:CAMPEP_0119508376 /NCGR_PEP_ID=MMETSP1344-20130328/28010_1 /TAXON_ID=236787 /ORGANISM="Florenciella parvula, Strain CCMP2471" /LENGTH=149 /DNA_ID=CAMNT_0007545113 /DNA_START=46 /DNA_END=491 /DNA_ORIENTATION=-